MSLWSRLVNVIRGDHLIGEIDEELESHIAGGDRAWPRPRRSAASLWRPDFGTAKRAAISGASCGWGFPHGPPLWRPDVAAPARISRGGGPVPGAWHRSKRGYLFGDRCGVAALPASQPSRAVGDGQRQRDRGEFLVPRLSGAAPGNSNVVGSDGRLIHSEDAVGIGGDVDEAFAKAVSGNYFTGSWLICPWTAFSRRGRGGARGSHQPRLLASPVQ